MVICCRRDYDVITTVTPAKQGRAEQDNAEARVTRSDNYDYVPMMDISLIADPASSSIQLDPGSRKSSLFTLRQPLFLSINLS